MPVVSFGGGSFTIMLANFHAEKALIIWSRKDIQDKPFISKLKVHEKYYFLCCFQ
jgi:hypothetical protein